MNVLVACEFSGIVRQAFRDRGHNAWSCDFLPAEDGSKYHFQGDVRDFLDAGWDMMIAHPPCTYLCVSGNQWMVRPGRQEARDEADSFFRHLYDAPIPKVAIENPIGVMSTRFRKPDQITHPWWFGEPTRKPTCLWLRGLPLLVPTDVVLPEAPHGTTPKGAKLYALNMLPKTADRWKHRSRTFQGLANAMADQWGGPLVDERRFAA